MPGCIAERLKTYLDKIISRQNPPGFLKGRFIGENIRLVYDLMNYTEQKHIHVPGLLMLIDFEKDLTPFLGNLFFKPLNSLPLETQ